jgi:hypothetical protein
MREMTRFDTLFQRIQRLVPPPPADGGWHYTRMRIEAASMAGTFPSSSGSTVPHQDLQAANGEGQLRLAAKLVRTDASPNVWDTDLATSWLFTPQDVAAASGGFFLDVWGRSLSVARGDGEGDPLYARRIVSDLSRPITTNQGLASAIDVAMGTSGTNVFDAGEVLSIMRFNMGNRMNSGFRFNNAGTAGDLWCCFVVQVPADVSEANLEHFRDIVNSRKAAGTRLVGMLTSAHPAPQISAPLIAATGTSFTATLAFPRPGATAWHWGVTGGTITAGAGTSTITILAGSGSTIDISLYLTEGGVDTATAHRDVVIGDPIASGIVSAVSIAQAGDGPFTASAPSGYFYVWSITNGYITTDHTLGSIQFGVGDKGVPCVLQCAITAGDFIAYLTYSIEVLPNAHVDNIVATLTDGTLTLGSKFLVTGIITDVPGRIRFYANAANRTADQSRSAGVTPAPNSGLIAEVVTTADALSVDPMHPWAIGIPTDTITTYWHWDGPAGANVTVKTMKQEA